MQFSVLFLGPILGSAHRVFIAVFGAVFSAVFYAVFYAVFSAVFYAVFSALFGCPCGEEEMEKKGHPKFTTLLCSSWQLEWHWIWSRSWSGFCWLLVNICGRLWHWICSRLLRKRSYRFRPRILLLVWARFWLGFWQGFW